jgi:hypothetical protein
VGASTRSDKNKENVSKDMSKRNLKRRTVKERMTQHNFRMLESDYRALQDHFEHEGVPIGQGIRMILKRYMNENGI